MAEFEPEGHCVTSSVANKEKLSREFRGIRFSRGKFLNLAQEKPQNVEKKNIVFRFIYLSIFYRDNFGHVHLKLTAALFHPASNNMFCDVKPTSVQINLWSDGKLSK